GLRRAEDDGDVLLGQQLRDLVALAGAADDELEALLLGEGDDVADVARLIDAHEDGQLALRGAGQRLEAQVARDARAAGDGPVVAAGLLEPLAQAVHRAVVLLLDFAEAALAGGSEAEPEAAAAGAERRPVHDHDGAGRDLHLLDGPAGEVEDGALAGESGGGAAEPAAAAGQRERVRDAVGAGDGDVLAGRVHRGAGLEVRREVAQLVEVVGHVDRTDLGEAELRARVEEAGIDVQARGVDDAGAGGRVDVRAERGDAAALDDDAADERRGGHGVDGAAADDERLLCGG